MVAMTVAVYLTESAYDEFGWAPRDHTVTALQNHLDNLASYDATVYAADDRYSYGSQDPTCDGPVFSGWKNDVNSFSTSYPGADSHLLFTNADNGGGCAEKPGKACCVGGAVGLNDINPPVSGYVVDSYKYFILNEAFHEVFHNFDAGHLDGNCSSDGSGSYYTTPMLTSYWDDYKGYGNNCGETIASQKDGYDTYWSPCAQQSANKYLS